MSALNMHLCVNIKT